MSTTVLTVAKDSTNVSIFVQMLDNNTHLPASGEYATGSFLTYTRMGSPVVDLSSSAFDLSSVTAPHADAGIIEVYAGMYRIDLPDAAFAGGVNHVHVHWSVNKAQGNTIVQIGPSLSAIAAALV